MVLPTYIVVKKILDNTELQMSQFYIDDYQTCEVIESGDESDMVAGDRILVGHQIFFDPASNFGKGFFFIYQEDVFGIVRDGVIIPRRSHVYIEADKDRKQTIKHGSLELYNDTTYNVLDRDNVVQDGTVLSVCSKAFDSYFDFPLDIEVVPGDKVYTHHFLTDEDNEREFNGKTYYEMQYENLYCKVKDGKIIMLNRWNFVSPVEDTDKITESGIILDFKEKNQLRVGTINHTSKSLIDKGINKGDLIFFKRGREYEIDVEGTIYYRIDTNDIIYKIE